MSRLRPVALAALVALLLLAPPVGAFVSVYQLRTTGLEEWAWWAKLMTLLTMLTWLSCLWSWVALRAPPE